MDDHSLQGVAAHSLWLLWSPICLKSEESIGLVGLLWEACPKCTGRGGLGKAADSLQVGPVDLV